MSPSEEKGLALGLTMTKFDRHKATHVTPAGTTKTKYFAVFEAPLKARHSLRTHAKSRAGAWRVAVRWFRNLQAGKL